MENEFLSLMPPTPPPLNPHFCFLCPPNAGIPPFLVKLIVHVPSIVAVQLLAIDEPHYISFLA